MKPIILQDMYKYIIINLKQNLLTILSNVLQKKKPAIEEQLTFSTYCKVETNYE